MKLMSERSKLRLDEDVYVLRARPRHPHVLVNLGYRAVAVVSCVGASILRKVELPETAGDFAIEGWILSPDGARSCLFGREISDFAIEIEHESGAARCIALPGDLAPPVGFSWFSPALHTIDASGQAWALKNDRFVHLGRDAAEAATRQLRARIPEFDELAVIRMNPSQQGVYLYGNSVVGYASIDATEVQFVPNEGAAIDVARLNGGLFVCSEEQVVHHELVEESVFLRAEPDERFVAIEALENAGTPYLVVDAGALDASSSTLRIFG